MTIASILISITWGLSPIVILLLSGEPLPHVVYATTLLISNLWLLFGLYTLSKTEETR